MRTVWVTGGAGFIGSHLVRYLVREYPSYRIHTLDALTYAGNLENLADVLPAANHTFHKIDIANASAVQRLWHEAPPDIILNLAAESHVDRSILSPMDFVHTNVLGTITLLEHARQYWQGRSDVLFYQVSTDEVYGSLGEEGFFTEGSAYDPRSPYSASKAAADHFVRAYGHTYGIPYLISNCGNNYGPFQFPEKLIPLTISRLIERKSIPVYGQGQNMRDWIYVEDHVRAIVLLMEKAPRQRTYLIGAQNCRPNIEVVQLLCSLYDEITGEKDSDRLITFVQDRPGHDFRYAICPSPLLHQLGWKPHMSFEEGLRQTIQWYRANGSWLERVRSGAYQEYFQRQYGERLSSLQ
ncbi:MAG: dTDP-glucose 4,6-dehydratase [Bacteroidia bacterium]|nr:dTDP-glucose 4,6-dehydratase [Bacteroidia bacterium]MDW8235209.1 dTDP-glucose 4,6-dehydratase [Bacteroidia bacterium]